MAKKKTPSWMPLAVYGSIAAGVGVAGWTVYKSVAGNNTLPEADKKGLLPMPGKKNESTLPRPDFASAFPLKVGDKNAFVQDVQNALIKMGGRPAEIIRNSGGADGAYGQGTKDALLAANFISVGEYIWKGNAYTNISRELYNKITNYGLGALHQPNGRIATAKADTWVLDEVGLRQNPPKGIPVKKGTIIGYYVTQNEGLAKVLRKNGTHVYTAFQNLTIT